MVEISLFENVTVNSTTSFVAATESDVAATESAAAAETDAVEAVAETDSVEACGLLSKLAITIATGWLIY